MLTIDRLKEVMKHNPCAAIFNANYLNDDIDSQQYKSMCGQRTSFIEFHQFMFRLTDIELQTLLKKHKEYVVNNYEPMEKDRFLDVSMTRAAIDYQLVLREGMRCETDLLTDIVKDWRPDVKLAESFEEITSDHLISFMKRPNG